MDIAQYTDKLKALLSSVALPAMLNNLSLPPAVKEKWDILDKRYLLIILSGILGFYLLIFVYVHFSADRTIAKMEQKMATIGVKLTEKELAPFYYTNDRGASLYSYNNYKPDIDSQTMANANLIEGLSVYDETIGRLPMIRSADSLTSFRAYQASFSLNGIGKKPVLSFIMKDYGLSDKDSNMALDILPPEVSFLLSSYATLPQEWINRARERGHEVWIEIPIQHGDHNDTGLNTIYHHNALGEKGRLLRKSLARGLGYVGVGVFMDQTALDSDKHYKKLVSELYGRGIAIFALNPEAPSFVESMAITKAAPYIKATGE
ncbi:MAG: divergent polysaccharide deacetylase family protein, partial [Alphaproteobacteria bacterium]|nr:divergent polysaccharide deacetylase family protein [Alphaproteobacteria bacterium]